VGCGKREGESWAGGVDRKREKGERRGKRDFLFLKLFSNSFSNFQTSIKQETMHSNHDAQSLIISNFIQVIFKYFKSQFIR
jgi:hypothetical protein